MNPPPNSNLDRMRQAAANKPAPAPRRIVPPQGGSGTAPPQGKKPPAGPKLAKPPKPPLKIYKEKVLYKCGHDNTPEEISHQDCPACRDKKRRDKAQKWRNDMVKKNERARTSLAGHPVVLRLPAGCVKTLTWNGEVWNGVLTVPGVDEPFRVTDFTEEKTFRGLHDVYIRWLAKQQAAQTPTVSDAQAVPPPG